MIFLIGGKGLVGSGFSRYLKKNKIKYKIITRKNKKNFIGKRCDVLIDCNGNGSKRKAYGDYRDDLLLELEKRIYNNIKTAYDTPSLDVGDVSPVFLFF